MEYGGLINSVEIPIPAEGQTVEVTTKTRIKEPYPGFTIFGNGKTTRKGGASMDILDICKELNLAEMNLMQFFRDYVEQNKMSREKNVNLVKPAASEAWTDYLKIALKKNYPHMECLGIIKRVKRGTYMMNPNLFIPTYSVELHNKEWSKLEDNCLEKKEN
jgi:hypothetical protein